MKSIQSNNCIFVSKFRNESFCAIDCARRTRYCFMLPLSSEQCDSFLRDGSHIFRHMWSAEPWGGSLPECWDVRRIMPRARQPAKHFFDSVRSGLHCRSDWYEGQLAMPNFTTSVPAILGFDDAIESICSDVENQRSATRRRDQQQCCACATTSQLNALPILAFEYLRLTMTSTSVRQMLLAIQT